MNPFGIDSNSIISVLKDESISTVLLLQNEDGLMEYFEEVMKGTKREPRKVIGWVTNELLGQLKQQDMSVIQRWETYWLIRTYWK